MTQQALAKAAGIAQASLSDLETGKSAGLHSDTLAALAKALHEDPEYIRTGRRAAARPGIDPAHTEILGLADTLSPQHRALWLEMGRMLAAQQAARNLQGKPEDARDRVAREVSKTIRELIETYGPDEVARILANFESAAGEQADMPGKTGKTKAKG